MNTKEASDYLATAHGVQRKPQTLSKLRMSGEGPTFLKIGRDVRYAAADLDAWVAKITLRATSTAQVTVAAAAVS